MNNVGLHSGILDKLLVATLKPSCLESLPEASHKGFTTSSSPPQTRIVTCGMVIASHTPPSDTSAGRRASTLFCSGKYLQYLMSDRGFNLQHL